MEFYFLLDEKNGTLNVNDHGHGHGMSQKFTLMMIPN